MARAIFRGEFVEALLEVRGSLTLCDDLLFYNSRIVVPSSLRRETMLKIHEGHQGMERCRSRLRTSVWWPGAASQIQQFVENCREYAEETHQRREPLLPTPLPDYPWQMVATDLFELKGDHHLLAVDYFSRYPEVYKLLSTMSNAIIAVLKSIFARHRILEILRSDNGPQYASKEFSEFAKSYRFNHLTSSPRFPQSNGQVERMVQTKIAETFSRPSSGTVIQGHTNAVVWIEPIRIVYGKEDKDHYSSGDEAANSKLVISP